MNVVTRLIIFLLTMTYERSKEMKTELSNYLDHDMLKVVKDVDLVKK